MKSRKSARRATLSQRTVSSNVSITIALSKAREAVAELRALARENPEESGAVRAVLNIAIEACRDIEEFCFNPLYYNPRTKEYVGRSVARETYFFPSLFTHLPADLSGNIQPDEFLDKYPDLLHGWRGNWMRTGVELKPIELGRFGPCKLNLHRWAVLFAARVLNPDLAEIETGQTPISDELRAKLLKPKNRYDHSFWAREFVEWLVKSTGRLVDVAVSPTYKTISPGIQSQCGSKVDVFETLNRADQHPAQGILAITAENDMSKYASAGVKNRHAVLRQRAHGYFKSLLKPMKI